MPQVKVLNIKKTFGKKIVALKNVSFEVQDQEYVTILGPSGCGKTTLLRIIAGLETPDTGDVLIEGKLMNNLPPEERNIGFVFQHFALFPHLNVWQNVIYGPRVRGLSVEKTTEFAHQLLELIRLAGRKDAYPFQLSMGMQQRVGLARALASGSKLLLLDEPLSSLDAQIKDEIKVELSNLARKLKLTAIHVTHDQDEAMFISHRIVLLKKGEVEQIGTPRELYQHPKSIFAANFIGDSNFLEAIVSERINNEVVVFLKNGQTINAASQQFSKGEKVVVAFRPEEAVLLQKQTHQYCLEGVISSTTFLAGEIIFEIALEGNLYVQAKVAPSSHNASLQNGERVAIEIQPERIFVYPYPETSLQEALRTD